MATEVRVNTVSNIIIIFAKKPVKRIDDIEAAFNSENKNKGASWSMTNFAPPKRGCDSTEF